MGEEGDDTMGKILPESFGSGGGRSERSSPVAPRERERKEKERKKKGGHVEPLYRQGRQSRWCPTVL
jgi:hypothetical protein